MENKVRVQDDLYQYVNGEWLATAVIPDDKPTCGGFNELNKNVEDTLMKDFKDMSEGTVAIPSENVGKAIALYNIAKNVKKRNKDGIKPILKTLKKIQKLTDIKAFNRNLKTMLIGGYPLPFSIDVDANMKDSLHNALSLTGPTTILPDTTYYQAGMEQQKTTLIGIWSNMVSQLLALCPLTAEEQALYIKDCLAFDEIIATLVKSHEEWSEYTKCYNPMKIGRVNSLMKPLKFKKLATDLFGTAPAEVIVYEPRFLKGFKTLFNEDNFELYKHWAYITELLASASLLSEKIRKIAFTYTSILAGIKAPAVVEKQAYQIASRFFSEPVGLYYGVKYFGEEAKNDVVEMVKEIIETYKARVAKNDILEEATKQKAILKLSTMEVKMGYPNKTDAFFDTLAVDENDNLVTAVSKIMQAKVLHSFAKLYKDVDRTEWVMPGHLVNACYNPSVNDITFPAAILQAPFYSIKQTRSMNLGGIGAVIGHEISHAFDNNGAKFDENGNLFDWWTKEDIKKFNAKTKAMIKQFDGLEIEGEKVNGKFVVSENIADNGGLAVTLDIMSRMEDADYTGFFCNWARVWCMKAKPEYTKLLLNIDVHSPAMLRANIAPRNFPEWYNTFNVTSKDKMYIAPAKRIIIW